MMQRVLFMLAFSCLLGIDASIAQNEALDNNGQWSTVNGQWQTVPSPMRRDYINNSNPYIGRTWNAIPDSLFREFKTTGNRTHYEDACFALRKQFANLAMGEIMEQQGRFIPDIVRGLRYFQNEVWWGIPAHYPKDHPEHDIQVVDLFNAETANMLAWAVYKLRS